MSRKPSLSKTPQSVSKAVTGNSLQGLKGALDIDIRQIVTDYSLVQL